MSDDVVVFGEVGLNGEIRTVASVDKRIAEAKKLGFNKAIVPFSKNSQDKFLVQVRDLRSALIDYLK